MVSIIKMTGKQNYNFIITLLFYFSWRLSKCWTPLLSSFFIGLLLGLLSAGVALAIVIAFWLTSSNQTSTTGSK